MWWPAKRHPLPLGLASDVSSSRSGLPQFEVILDPPIPAWKRFKQLGRQVIRKYRPGRGCMTLSCVLCLLIGFEIIIAVYTYYYCSQKVYPASKAASEIHASRSRFLAFSIFFWVIAVIGTIFNVAIFAGLFYWIFDSMRLDYKDFWLTWGIKIIGTLTTCVLGTAPLWASWPITTVWQVSVYRHACEGWEAMAVLQGVSTKGLNSSLPVIGNATIQSVRGNYMMQLARNDSDENVYYFYLKNHESFNYTPSISKISYNTTEATYMISDITTSYLDSPNLAFPALGLELRDVSIPFRNSWGPPAVDLVQSNDGRSVKSSLLRTVTTNHFNCTQLKVCGISSDEDKFQIALGIVLIEQFNYSIRCTENSSPSNYTFSSGEVGTFTTGSFRT